MTDLIQFLFNGLVVGSIFAIAAVGISLLYSVLRLVNFAAGDFLTLGAFITYFLSVTMELNFFLSVFISMLAGMGISWFLELVLWRNLRRNKAGTLALFLVATGVALMLRPLIQYFFGTETRKFNIDILKTYDLFGARIAHTQMLVLIFASASIITIALFISKARIGKDMRAYANNPGLAAVSGINVDRVVLATWLISGALGSLAGVFLGLVQGQFNNSMGESLLLSFFAAVVLGTIGDAYGALVGGLLLGLFTELSQLSIFFGGVPSNYKPVVAFTTFGIGSSLQTRRHFWLSGEKGLNVNAFLQPGFWVFVLALAGIYGIFALGLTNSIWRRWHHELWTCRHDGSICLHNCSASDQVPMEFLVGSTTRSSVGSTIRCAVRFNYFAFKW